MELLNNCIYFLIGGNNETGLRVTRLGLGVRHGSVLSILMYYVKRKGIFFKKKGAVFAV